MTKFCVGDTVRLNAKALRDCFMDRGVGQVVLVVSDDTGTPTVGVTVDVRWSDGACTSYDADRLQVVVAASTRYVVVRAAQVTDDTHAEFGDEAWCHEYAHLYNTAPAADAPQFKPHVFTRAYFTRVRGVAPSHAIVDTQVSPRYVMRRAEEMRIGDDHLDAYSGPRAEMDARAKCDALNRDGVANVTTLTGRDRVWSALDATEYTHAIVDIQRVPTPACVVASPPTPAPPAPVPSVPAPPAWPSDAEICAAYALFQQQERTCKPQCDHVNIGGWDGVNVPMAEVRAAWSRELKRLAAVSAERERMRVVVQCQDGEECP